MTTPINPPPGKIEIDPRDWCAWRDRIIACEERIADLQLASLGQARELALFMMGTKERLDEHRDLFARLEARLAQLEHRA